MERVEPVENENNTENPTQERAIGILDTIDALIGLANNPENGETPDAGKQAAEIEAKPEQSELTEELVQTIVAKALDELKADVRKMIDHAIANLPQSEQSSSVDNPAFQEDIRISSK